jgi:dethiobiotin synthetase
VRGVFVTGTGTEVGKTVVAAAIARTAAARGDRVAVFKPAVSGLDDYRDSPPPPDHQLLRLAAGSDQADDEIAPYRYGPPVSPHLGAELAGEAIDRERLLATARAALAGADILIGEGVGGLLVPLAADYLVRDLARDLGLPLVVAASPALGTINHTLLTLEAARAADLEVAAVVLTPWPEAPSLVEESNRETVERLGGVGVGLLPPLDVNAPDTWPALDPTGLYEAREARRRPPSPRRLRARRWPGRPPESPPPPRRRLRRGDRAGRGSAGPP